MSSPSRDGCKGPLLVPFTAVDAAYDLAGVRFSVCEKAREIDECERRAREQGDNLLRLLDMPGSVAWGDSALAVRDIVLRPNWISWLQHVPAGAESLLALQSSRQRQRTRAALRLLSRYRFSISEPVTARAWSEWLSLYLVRVAEMKNGVPLAATRREQILDPCRAHALLSWRDESGNLVGGLVVHRNMEPAILRVRFSAVDRAVEAREVTRGMYAAAADLARSWNLAMLSLGTDMNFYGAVVKPGLCLYKLRLGMRPVAAASLRPGASNLVADKILSLADLDQPVLTFEQVARRGRLPEMAAPYRVNEPDDIEAASRELELVAFVSEKLDERRIGGARVSRVEVVT